MTPDDSARNRKMRKMMSLNCSICSMPVFGVGKDIEFGLRKGAPPSISLSVCCELGWRGSNNVRKAYRGVECMPPAPPAAMLDNIFCFCDNEAFLAYSKPDHVSNVSHLFVLGDLHCGL